MRNGWGTGPLWSSTHALRSAQDDRLFEVSAPQKPVNSGKNRQKQAKSRKKPQKIVEITAFCLDFTPAKVAW
jgi:hypothetical protein